MTFRNAIVSVVVLLVASGCPIESLAPGKVATGLAQLSARDAAVLTAAINQNSDCGFAAKRVIDSAVIKGERGGLGSITYSVKDCEIDFGDKTELQTDCTGITTSAGGKVVLNATSVVDGMLTGDASNPIVPLSSEAAHLTISVQMKGFWVLRSDSGYRVIHPDNAMAWEASPKLAVSTSLKVCAVPTNELTLTHVRLEKGKVELDVGDHTFPVDVQSSDFAAQFGRWGDKENTLEGTVKVWNSQERLPIDGNTEGLVPGYDAKAFVDAYACTKDLAQPVNFQCPTLDALCMSTGCPVESLAPDKVATGLAQLTARDLAVLTAAINENKECGFAAPSVVENATLVGAPGTDGEATYVVKDCAIDFGTKSILQTDCSGITTSASGLVVINASRTVSGTLTGDPKNAVVPLSPEAARITMTASMKGFSVLRSDSAYRIVHDSTVHWDAAPKLAVSRSLGVCAVATNELTLSHVRYEAGKVILDLGNHAFPVEIRGSDFSAQFGRWGDKENTLEGTLRLWNSEQHVPQPGDTQGLVPGYERAAFIAAYACNTDLVQPTNFTCPSLDVLLAEGVARLSVQALAELGAYFDTNLTCGFSSPSVASRGTLQGSPGVAGGNAAFNVTTPCTETLPLGKTIRTDCHGTKTQASGFVGMTGQARVTAGILTGDSAQPIAPTGSQVVDVDATFELRDFALSNTGTTNTLKVSSGTLSGNIKPDTAIDTVTGVCSKKTGVVAAHHVKWSNGKLIIGNGQSTFVVNVDDSNLEAQVGAAYGKSNVVSGTVTINGKTITLPEGMPLDPTYTTDAAYQSTFECADLRVPRVEEECDMLQPLAENAARLVVQNAGALAQAINDDKQCGFADTLGVLTRPSAFQGASGEMGWLKWNIAGCQVNYATPTIQGTNCVGTKTYVEGAATFDAERTVTGLRERKFVVFKSISPRSTDAATMVFQRVSLANFAAYTLESGAAAPVGKLTLQSGTLSGTVIPYLGENSSTAGVFDIPTPVATFNAMVLSQATAKLESGGKTFLLTIPELRVDQAQNGSYRSVANTISGKVQMGGRTLIIDHLPLDPAYNQSKFDQAYACTANLKGVLAP